MPIMKSSRLCLVAVIAAGASLPIATQTFAQESSTPRISQNEWNALTDERIAIVKAALQLTPEQQKYWPAVEKAIRARAASRENRINAAWSSIRSRFSCGEPSIASRTSTP